MVTDQAEPPLDVDPSLIGELELDRFEVPYADLNDERLMHTRLLVSGTEYVYLRSFPIRGHSAVMPAAVAELLAEGRQLLIAERNERYYVYSA